MPPVQFETAGYVFGSGQSELQRLIVQANDLKSETEWLLDHVGVKEGWRAVDIGCGPIGILDMLSQRVGRSGRVVGVERETRFVEMAQAEIARRRLTNATVVSGDALSADFEYGTFDLVHERLVLINMPPSNQQALVDQMAALARPGGTVAVASWDRASHVCYPQHPSWDILDQAYREAVRTTNGDGAVGRTLPSLLRSAGISSIRTKAHVRIVEIGELRRTHRIEILKAARRRILALGRMSENEFDTHLKAVAEHLDDPETLLIDQLLVQAWGQKITGVPTNPE